MVDTLPKTDISIHIPWNLVIPKGNEFSNHPFSGALLVSGGGISCYPFISFHILLSLTILYTSLFNMDWSFPCDSEKIHKKQLQKATLICKVGKFPLQKRPLKNNSDLGIFRSNKKSSQRTNPPIKPPTAQPHLQLWWSFDAFLSFILYWNHMDVSVCHKTNRKKRRAQCQNMSAQ